MNSSLLSLGVTVDPEADLILLRCDGGNRRRHMGKLALMKPSHPIIVASLHPLILIVYTQHLNFNLYIHSIEKCRTTALISKCPPFLRPAHICELCR